jgi:hypothetical protein
MWGFFVLKTIFIIMKLFIKKILKEELIKKSLSDDMFIHFTTLENSKNIIDKKSLGKDGFSTWAVSAKWGIYNKGAVLPKNEKRQVAILFKTNKLPKYGYAEEVVWDGIVPFTMFKIISIDNAIKILQKSELKTNVADDDKIKYTV